MPPVFPSWELRGLGGEPLVVSPFDAPPLPASEPMPAMFVLAHLRSWLVDPDARPVLLDLHAHLAGRLPLSAWGADDLERATFPALSTAFERGDLVVWMRLRESRPAPTTRPITARPPPGKRPPPVKIETTFIEIVLVDSAGDPVPGERYRVTVPDGSVRTGRLDRNGFARIDGIDPGQCEIDFPDRDGREWAPSLPKGPLA